MANLLFVIHGMGVHNDLGAEEDAQHHWCVEIEAKLDEIAAHFDGFDLGDNRFSKQVRIVPITYDAPFRELLAQWNGQAIEIKKTITEESIPGTPPVVDWLAQLDGQAQQKFFWSHVVDVLLYEFFSNVAKQIRLLVIDRILDAIAAARAADPVVSIQFLAHSLGTAVLHDSLALLSTQARAAELEGPGFRFGSVFMLANVSRVLEDHVDALRVYKSVVCPPNAGHRPHYFNFYWNVRHRLDPVPVVRPFAPADWDQGDYSDVRVNRLIDFNTHGFVPYLEQSAVHEPLIAMAAGRVALTPTDQPYKPPPPPCAGTVGEFETEAQALLALVQGNTTPFDLIKAATHFLAIVEKAKEECGEVVAGIGDL